MKNLYFLFLLLLGGCNINRSNYSISDISNNTKMYIIDIDKIEPAIDVKLSDFFSEIEYIPLETNDEVLLSRISKLYAYNDTLYVLDKLGCNALFLFDKKDGSYLGRIGSVGQGPGEYSKVGDFTIDIENRKLFLLDLDRQQILEFELGSGSFIRSIDLNRQISRTFHVQYENKAIYGDLFFQNRVANNDFLLNKLDIETGDQVNCWLSAQEYNLGWKELFFAGESAFHSQPFHKPKFTQLFMNTIMEIGSDEVTPFLSLKTKNWISKTELDRLEGNPSERYNKLMQIDRVYHIGNLMEVGDLIYFTYKEGMDTYHLFYNKETKEFKYSNSVINDLLYKEKTLDALDLNFCFSDNEGGYCYIHPFAMKRFIEGIHSSAFCENFSYKKLLDLNEEANPVILYYKKK